MQVLYPDVSLEALSINRENPDRIAGTGNSRIWGRSTNLLVWTLSVILEERDGSRAASQEIPCLWWDSKDHTVLTTARMS